MQHFYGTLSNNRLLLAIFEAEAATAAAATWVTKVAAAGVDSASIHSFALLLLQLVGDGDDAI